MASGTCTSETVKQNAHDPGSDNGGPRFSSHNPFEMDICSLSLPACSPDVFCLAKKDKAQETNANDSFRWSIGQVSVLKPANIDENSHQATVERWDDDKEFRAQKAIETFFLHNSVCPSPWNGAMALKHVTFSPHLASTAYYSRSDSLMGENSELPQSSAKKDVWTQTTLTVPADIDIFQLLGDFFTFLDNQKDQKYCNETDLINDAKDLSNSSLRRKLFSPKRQEEEEQSPSAVPLPKSPLKFCTPEKSLRYKFVPTPTSGGTYFSSSPISTKNCSMSGSPMEHNLSSPPLSPILMRNLKQCNRLSEIKEKLQMLPNTPIAKKSSTGRFRSSSDECGRDIGTSPSLAMWVSLSSGADTDGHNQNDDNKEMEADRAKFDSTQCSDMQVSVVQYSSDEKASSLLTGASTFQPSVLSQDTGYKTESYQQSLEGTSLNNNESKEKTWPKWMHQGHDTKHMDSVIEVSDYSQSCEVGVVRGLDNNLVEQCNWKPHGFSTPH